MRRLHHDQQPIALSFAPRGGATVEVAAEHDDRLLSFRDLGNHLYAFRPSG